MLKYKCIVFDLDGTIYFGSELANKANEVIAYARKISEHVFFVTNNSAKTREQVFDKLVKLGVNLKKEELITSSYAIAKYLKENDYKEIYCIGTEFLKQEIELCGINTNSKEPKAVVVGYNPNFKLSDLEELSNIKLSEYKLIIANKERNYPKENGYAAAGILLINIEYWRKNKIEQKCLDFISANKESCKWHDQDALNKVLNGTIKFCPLKYNAYELIFEGDEKEYPDFFLLSSVRSCPMAESFRSHY